MAGYIVYSLTNSSVLSGMPSDRVDLTITWITGNRNQSFLKKLEELGVIMIWEVNDDTVWKYRWRFSDWAMAFCNFFREDTCIRIQIPLEDEYDSQLLSF